MPELMERLPGQPGIRIQTLSEAGVERWFDLDPRPHNLPEAIARLGGAPRREAAVFLAARVCCRRHAAGPIRDRTVLSAEMRESRSSPAGLLLP